MKKIHDPFSGKERAIGDCSDRELENIGHNTYYRLLHERRKGLFSSPCNLEWIDEYEKQLEVIREELVKRNKGVWW